MSGAQKAILHMVRGARQAYDDREFDLGFDRAIIALVVSRKLFGRAINMCSLNALIIAPD